VAGARPGPTGLSRRANRGEGIEGWIGQLPGRPGDLVDEDARQLGVELPAGRRPELVERPLEGSCGSVGAVVGDGIEGVDEPDDPGADRDVLAAQVARVAGPIPMLVVVADDRPEGGEGAERGADALSDLGMAPDEFPLVVIERTALRQDRIGDADLADVMEQGAIGDGIELGGREAEADPEPPGEEREPLAVMLGLGVLGLDGVRQRRDHRMSGLHANEGTTEAQGAPDPGDELGLREGLRDEVVGPGIQAGHDVGRQRAARQEEDREGDVASVHAQAACQLETIDAGKADVEEDEIGVDGRDRGEAGLPVRDRMDAEALGLEQVGQQRPIGVVVLDDEDRPDDLLGGGEGRPPTLTHVVGSLFVRVGSREE
jgi:hypothetical protein